MLTLILILLLLHSFLYFLIKPKKSILGCGIFCYVGDRPADPEKLKILALYNITRGDHATGICIDNQIIKELSNAREFLANNYDLFSLINDELSNFAVLGHCRQATAMYAKDNVKFAHPHAMFKNPTDDTPSFFGVHNGTITNCYDLCDKHDLNYNSNSNSDSMIFFSILSSTWGDKKLEILREYEGSATVVFYPANSKNTLYVHRDKARELYYWQESENSCYISSIKLSLLAIGAQEKEIVEFEAGMLFKFYNGHITKKWDFTEKKPYEKPRPVKHYSPKHTSSQTFKQNQPKEELEGKTDGFIWKDHRIYYNGHLFTGIMYIDKHTKKPERFIVSQTKTSFDSYYCIMGVVIKDETSYKKLYTECSVLNEFKHELFKKIMIHDLQPYILYPILGKTYEETINFFWSDEFNKMKNPLDVYEWSPVLSNKIFKCNKAGYLQEEIDLNAKKSLDGQHYVFLKNIIEEQTNTDQDLKDIQEVFKKYEELVKKSPLKADFRTWDNFVTYSMDVLAEYGYCTNNGLAMIDNYRNMEDFYGTMDNDYLISRTLLKEYNNTIDALKQLSVPEPVKDVSEALNEYENQFDQTELAYYETQDFKNKVLFGNYDSLDAIIADYIITDEAQYLMALFIGIAKLFSEIGILTSEEVLKLQDKGTVGAKLMLSREYDNLRQLSGLKAFFSSCQDSSEDINACASKIYGLYLQEKNTKKNNINKEILRLGLKYIRDKGKLNSLTLLNQYNLSLTEIDVLCQP